jgi:hypothetical protein
VYVRAINCIEERGIASEGIMKIMKLRMVYIDVCPCLDVEEMQAP